MREEDDGDIVEEGEDQDRRLGVVDVFVIELHLAVFDVILLQGVVQFVLEVGDIGWNIDHLVTEMGEDLRDRVILS